MSDRASALVALDPRLEPLLAVYVRGEAGAAEVLHDALLERALEPLPAGNDPHTRLEAVFALLSPTAQTAIGSASARRVLDRFSAEFPKERAPAAALDALDGSAPAPDALRQAVFKAWRACGSRPDAPDAARVAWAVWMLMRDMPVVALRTIRAIEAAELDAQIELVAAALGR